MLISPNNAGFGCRVSGIDIAATSTDSSVVPELKRLLFKYKVIVIKDQSLTDLQYINFMRSIGNPIIHPLSEFSLPTAPEIIRISNYIRPDGAQDGVLYGGAYWHSDMSYLEKLGIATSLYTVNAPEHGPSTKFVDLESGLKAITRDHRFTAKLREFNVIDLDRLMVVHKFGNRRALTDNRAHEQALQNQTSEVTQSVSHKLIVDHPVTSKRALFAISGSSFQIEGMNEADSISLLNSIEDYTLVNSESYEHEYSSGDLLIWDNISTLHCGRDISPCKSSSDSRVLHRINVHYG